MFKLASEILKNPLGVLINAIVYPLRILYFHGPGLGGYGFLEGRNKESICYDATGIKSEFWSSSVAPMEECEILIEKKFHAFVIGFSAILTTYVVLSNLYLISIRHFISRPLTAVVEKKFDESVRIINSSGDTIVQ